MSPVSWRPLWVFLADQNPPAMTVRSQARCVTQMQTGQSLCRFEITLSTNKRSQSKKTAVWSLTYCRMCARVECTARGGAAWQTEAGEGGEEGSRPRGGRAAAMAAAAMVEGAGEAKAALIALPGAKSGA